MHKLKNHIANSITHTRLEGEFNRLGREVINAYTFESDMDVSIQTIAEALEVDRQRIEAEDARRRKDGKPYVDLTSWELLQPDELLITYDIEANEGRLLTTKELDDYIGSPDGTSLTPAGIRRWYVNRKNEDEYLVSDYKDPMTEHNVPTFWIVE